MKKHDCLPKHPTQSQFKSLIQATNSPQGEFVILAVAKYTALGWGV